MSEPRLTVELVPRTCFFSNVRSEVSAAMWKKCQRFAREQSNERCEICGEVGPDYPVECHERWEYDDENKIQRLVGLIALCPRCHRVKHFGRTINMGGEQDALLKLCSVNGWTLDRTESYLQDVFKVWQERSRHQWQLDISWLDTIGVKPRKPAQR